MSWELLELDPATATAKDVKRSYAKRLKTCRPDQDPEGFRLLHEAYTGALAELQWREGPGGSPAVLEALEVVADSPSTDDAVLQEQQLPGPEPVELSPGQAAVADIMERLESALRSGGGGVAELMREAESVLVAHPGEVERWGELLHDLIRNHGKHEDLRLKPEAILFELERNGLAATVAVIDRLDRLGVPRGIRGLSDLFSANRKRIATPAGGIACARLAGVAAFWAPGAVEELANLAYENLARGERDFHMQMIDQHAGMRGFLELAPEHMRSFLRQRLMNDGGVEVWQGEEAAEVMRWLKTPRVKAGPLYEVIRKLVPDAVAAEAGLPLLEMEPETVTLSSPAGGAKPRVKRPAPPRRSRLAKPGDELDWEEDEEEMSAPMPERVARREAASATPTKPAAARVEKAAGDKANWLDLENQPTRRDAVRVSERQARGSGRKVLWLVVAIVIAVKVILAVVRVSFEGP